MTKKKKFERLVKHLRNSTEDELDLVWIFLKGEFEMFKKEFAQTSKSKIKQLDPSVLKVLGDYMS